MSKGGGGGGSTTSVQKADPWVGLQAPLKSLYAGAMDQYNSGGPKYYEGQTIADPNQNVQNSLSMGVDRSMQGQDPIMGAASGQLQRTMNGVGIGNNPAFNQLSAFGNGQYLQNNPAMGGINGLNSGNGTFQQFANGSMLGSNPSLDYLQNAANGSFMDKQNPYLSDMVKNATDPMVEQFQKSIAPGLASQFSAAGRTGSGAHEQAFTGAADSLGRSLANASSSIYGNAYESERGRQQQAVGMLGDLSQQEKAQQLQGAQGMLSGYQSMGGMYDNAVNQQMHGLDAITGQYTNERNLQNTASLAAPQFAQNSQNMDYDRIAKLMGVGQFQQGQQQQYLDANKAKYDYQQQAPLQNLQALNQLLQGGSAYATQSKSGSESTNRNPFVGAVGGMGMGQALNMAGAGFGPAGLIGGALLGGLFG